MSDVLRFTAYRATTYSRSGAVRRCWTVHAMDERGDPVFGLDWDADYGELVSVRAARTSPELSGAPILPPAEIVRLTRDWLRVLGVAATAPSWRVIGRPEHADSGIYTVRWRAPDREAVVLVRDRTGHLFRADVMRARPGSRLPRASRD